MKKLVGFVLFTSLMMLAACGESNDGLSMNEVLDQSIKATGGLNSYTADMKIDTEMMGMEVSIEAAGNITHDPDALYLDMAMGMTGFTMDLEVYAVDEEIYMSMFGEWLIMEEEDLGLESFDQLTAEELEKLKNFEEQFEMREEDDVYVLTLSGEGEEFEALLDSYLEASMGDLAMDPMWEDEALFEFGVNQLEMELTIEKETMYVISQIVDAEIEIDGEASQLHVESTISDMNEIEPIEVPEEIKESAVMEDVFDEEFGLVEEPMTLEEIQEVVDYTIPVINDIPEAYEMTETYYDEFADMTSLFYEKDAEHLLVLSVFPSKEAYGEMYIVGETEETSINGNEGLLETLEDNYMFLTWEHEGVLIELISEGSEMTKEALLETAESIK